MLAPVLYVLSRYVSLMLADEVVKTYIAAAKNCIKHYFLLLKIRTLKSPLGKFYLVGFWLAVVGYDYRNNFNAPLQKQELHNRTTDRKGCWYWIPLIQNISTITCK